MIVASQRNLELIEEYARNLALQTSFALLSDVRIRKVLGNSIRLLAHTLYPIPMGVSRGTASKRHHLIGAGFAEFERHYEQRVK